MENNVDAVLTTLEEHFTPMAEAIKEMSGAGWDILLAKVLYVDGYIGLIGALLCFATAIPCFIKITKGVRAGTDGDWCIIPGCIGLVTIAIAIPLFFTSLPRIFIPEYYALKEIIDMAL